ncbi:MAG: TlpA family protein disulfide reductase [Acidobacteria bacterium]|nr:TlpA family protein disulfide reductase [Acidobacteriota bacterium]
MKSEKLTMATGTLAAALAVSVLLNVALAARASQQRKTLEAARIAAQPLVGKNLTGLDAARLDGEPTRVILADQPVGTVLYVFRPDCAWCERNHEAVLALHAQAKGSHRFVGIALTATGLDGFLARNPLPFDVYTGVDEATIESFQLAGTPRTLVIGPDGTVTANWFGAYFGTVADEIESRLAVSLPRVDIGEDHN